MTANDWGWDSKLSKSFREPHTASGFISLTLCYRSFLIRDIIKIFIDFNTF